MPDSCNEMQNENELYSCRAWASPKTSASHRSAPLPFPSRHRTSLLLSRISLLRNSHCTHQIRERLGRRRGHRLDARCGGARRSSSAPVLVAGPAPGARELDSVVISNFCSFKSQITMPLYLQHPPCNKHPRAENKSDSRSSKPCPRFFHSRGSASSFGSNRDWFGSSVPTQILLRK